MQLGSYRRIYKQDYKPEAQDVIDTLSVTVNDSFESVYSALTNNLNFADNFNCTIATFTTTVSSTGTPNNPVTIKLNTFQKTVTGIFVINAVASKSGINPTGGVLLGYTINNNTGTQQNNVNKSNPLTVTINGVFGIPASQEFTITAILI
jgi:hypothetical protein